MSTGATNPVTATDDTEPPGFAARWYGRVTTRRGGPLSPERGAARLSAYVYGTILALAAVVAVDTTAIEHGTAVLLVLGTTATTYIAHVFAETVAHHSIPEIDDGMSERDRRRAALDEFRDAQPIASAGAIPAFFLVLGWLDVVSPEWALILAGAGPVVRIALIEVMARRIRGEKLTFGVLVGGVVTALVATAIVIVKVAITH